MAASTAGMVTDPEQFEMCSIKRLPPIAGKLFELQDLEKAILQTMSELESDRSDSNWARWGLFAARVAKVGADATMSIIGDVVGKQNVAVKSFSAAYAGVTPLADIAGKKSAGAPVTGYDVTKAFAAGVNASVKVFAARNADNKMIGAVKSAVDLKKIESDLVVDAMKKDGVAIAKDVASAAALLAKMSVDYAKQETVGKVIAGGKTLLNAAMDVVKSYNEFSDNDMSANFDSFQKSFRGNLDRVRVAIAALQKVIVDWEFEQAQMAVDSAARASMPRLGIGL